MTSCEHLSDRMPLVLRGETTWSAEEAAHLATCEECRLEWDLVSTASGLGRNAAAGLDPHHVAERVLGRLRAERHRRGRRLAWAAAALAAAAVLALAVWTNPGHRSSGAPAPGVDVAAIQLPELDSLATPELEAVLQSLNAPIGTSVESVDSTGLDDLDTPDLERVLDRLEG
jgi:anti-sigma factor RsiW